MSAMRIYVFKSATTKRLRAFAGDPDVNKLPRQHGPWTVTGTIHRTMILLTTSRETRSRKQSMRKAFSFGACATRQTHRTDEALYPSLCPTATVHLTIPVAAELRL